MSVMNEHNKYIFYNSSGKILVVFSDRKEDCESQVISPFKYKFGKNGEIEAITRKSVSEIVSEQKEIKNRCSNKSLDSFEYAYFPENYEISDRSNLIELCENVEEKNSFSGRSINYISQDRNSKVKTKFYSYYVDNESLLTKIYNFYRDYNCRCEMLSIDEILNINEEDIHLDKGMKKATKVLSKKLQYKDY